MSAKDPPIRVWTEKIDDKVIAGNAACFVVRGGWVYGLGVFVMVDLSEFYDATYRRDDYWKAKRAAAARAQSQWAADISQKHGGRLPAVAMLRDLEGANGIDLKW